MKTQRIIALTKKEVKKTIREPAVLFMIFLFPVVFVVVFGASFGGVGGGQPTYNLGVVNLDHATSINASQLLLSRLTDTQLLTLHPYTDNASAHSALSQGNVQAVIIIPQNFSQSYASYLAAPNTTSAWTLTTVTLFVDKGSVVATQAVPPIIQQTLLHLAGMPQGVVSPFQLQTSSFAQAQTLSALDVLAPGVFTFASIFLIMMVAQSFVQDRENGMMRRIRISPTTPSEFMTSQVIAYMLIAFVQAALVFVVVFLLGFRPAVGAPVYLFAFGLVLLFSLSNIGFGLITATLARSGGAATGLSFLFVLPQLFLGTFVGASLSKGAQVAGRFVPSSYVTDALTSVFVRGAAMTSMTVVLDAVVVGFSCLAILIVGVVLYAKFFRI